jgi:predicted DNA-binding transcriptional regulator AlpA
MALGSFDCRGPFCFTGPRLTREGRMMTNRLLQLHASANAVSDVAEAIQPDGPTAKEPAPLLTDINGLSRLLQRSVASLHRDDAAGRIPAGVKIGSSKRWRVGEIAAWIEAGCPRRLEWNTRRDAGRRRAL